jgi:hypothetical protein
MPSCRRTHHREGRRGLVQHVAQVVNRADVVRRVVLLPRHPRRQRRVVVKRHLLHARACRRLAEIELRESRLVAEDRVHDRKRGRVPHVRVELRVVQQRLEICVASDSRSAHGSCDSESELDGRCAFTYSAAPVGAPRLGDLPRLRLLVLRTLAEVVQK